MTTGTTIQLRRYVLLEPLFDDFLQWWDSRIAGLRRNAGFTIESAYADRDNHEFVWAISTPGGIGDFQRLETVYLESEERRRAFEGIPDWVTSSVVSFVDDLT